MEQTIDRLPHQHVFGDWLYTDSVHYHLCACGTQGDVATHAFIEGTVIRPATEDEEGLALYTCSVCGYTVGKTLDRLPHQHVFGDWQYTDSQHYHVCACGVQESDYHRRDCGYLTEVLDNMNGRVTISCTICGYVIDEYDTPLVIHTFDAVTEYPDEGEEGARYTTCSHCGIVYRHYHHFSDSYDSETHFSCCLCGLRREESAHVFDEGVVTRPATDLQSGIIEYTCTVCGYIHVEYTDPLPHVHDLNRPYSYDDAHHYIRCPCGEEFNYAAHTISEVVEQRLSTLQDGVRARTCSVCGYREEFITPRVELSYLLAADGAGYEVSLSEFPSEPFDLIVPAEHNGLPVTAIADRAFNSRNYSQYIQSVTLPDTLTRIGQSAFYYTSSLVSLTIPSGVQYIEDGAFSLSGIRSLSLPSSLVGLSLSFWDSDFDYTIYRNACYLGNEDNPHLVLARATSRYVTSCEIHPDCRLIAPSAFVSCSSLTEVTLPDTVTYIGRDAFSGCTNLRYNTYENGAYLGNADNPYYALMAAHDGGLGTYHQELHTHDSCVLIAPGAYCYDMGNAQPLSVTLTDSVRYVHAYTFFRANVRHLTIGAGLSLTGDNYFTYCPIEDIVVSSDNPYMVYENGVLYSKDKRTVLMCRPATTSIVVADGVTAIAPYAFAYDTALTSISLPDSVRTIGEYAFGFCVSAVDFTLPAGLTYIHKGGLYRCAMLVDGLVLPQGLRTIGAYAFCDDVNIWGTLTIPDGCLVVGYHAFDGCENISRLVMLSDTVVDEAFYYSNVTSIRLGAAVTRSDWLSQIYAPFNHLQSIEVADGNAVFYAESGYLCRDGEVVFVPNALSGELVITSRFGENAFAARSQITAVVIDNDMTSIPAYAFSGCTALREVEIRNASITFIGNDAFARCTALETFPAIDGLTSIDQGILWDCSRLQTICIGPEVRYISANAFSGLASLKSFIVHPDNPYFVVVDGVLYNNAMTSLIKCPPMREAEGTFVVPDTVKSISNYAFENCLWLEEFTLGCYAGAYAFEGCLNLRSVTFGEGVTRIEQGLFSGCTGLAAVSLPEGLDRVYPFAFDGCSALTSIAIPASVSAIDDFAFRGCTALRSVSFAEGSALQSIEFGAFLCCGLMDVTLPEGLTSIGTMAFQANVPLVRIELPTTLATVDDYAFDGCYSLYEVVNHSALALEVGSSSFGGVAQYAAAILADRSLSTIAFEGDFITAQSADDVVLLKYIGQDAQVTVPDGFTAIAGYAFAENQRVAICTIPDGVRAIGDGVFRYCSAIVRVSLPATLQTFGESVFSNCFKLTELINPSAVDLSGDFFIQRYSPAVLTSLAESEIYLEDDFILRSHEAETILLGYAGEATEIVIPAYIDEINHHAFYRSAVEKVTVLTDIEELAQYVFSLCTSLKELHFGASVTYVDTFGIEAHYALSSVYYGGTVAQFEAIMTPNGEGSYVRTIPLIEFLSPRTTVYCTDGKLTGTGSFI